MGGTDRDPHGRKPGPSRKSRTDSESDGKRRSLAAVSSEKKADEKPKPRRRRTDPKRRRRTDSESDGKRTRSLAAVRSGKEADEQPPKPSDLQDKKVIACGARLLSPEPSEPAAVRSEKKAGEKPKPSQKPSEKPKAEVIDIDSSSSDGPKTKSLLQSRIDSPLNAGSGSEASGSKSSGSKSSAAGEKGLGLQAALAAGGTGGGGGKWFMTTASGGCPPKPTPKPMPAELKEYMDAKMQSETGTTAKAPPKSPPGPGDRPTLVRTMCIYQCCDPACQAQVHISKPIGERNETDTMGVIVTEFGHVRKIISRYCVCRCGAWHFYDMGCHTMSYFKVEHVKPVPVESPVAPAASTAGASVASTAGASVASRS
jgi:hypothetical protein